MKEQYYEAYEKRYQAAYSAGAERWGNSPEDENLYNVLKNWVKENGLKGKKIIEYACGEGACGVILWLITEIPASKVLNKTFER